MQGEFVLQPGQRGHPVHHCEAVLLGSKGDVTVEEMWGLEEDAEVPNCEGDIEDDSYANQSDASEDSIDQNNADFTSFVDDCGLAAHELDLYDDAHGHWETAPLAQKFANLMWNSSVIQLPDREWLDGDSGSHLPERDNHPLASFIRLLCPSPPTPPPPFVL